MRQVDININSHKQKNTTPTRKPVLTHPLYFFQLSTVKPCFKNNRTCVGFMSKLLSDTPLSKP